MAGGNFVSVRGESGSGIEELERNIHAVIAFNQLVVGDSQAHNTMSKLITHKNSKQNVSHRSP